MTGDSTCIFRRGGEIADRIGIINGGKLIAVGTREELRKQSGSSGQLEEIFLSLTAEEK